ncbi:MAG: hypothetical protein MK006_15020, partial [Pirellulales bacterium]|nr:hypothetical protein [Pirellulales bacterium]
ANFAPIVRTVRSLDRPTPSSVVTAKAFELTGNPVENKTITFTIDGTDFDHQITANDTLNSVAEGIASEIHQHADYAAYGLNGHVVVVPMTANTIPAVSTTITDTGIAVTSVGTLDATILTIDDSLVDDDRWYIDVANNDELHDGANSGYEINQAQATGNDTASVAENMAASWFGVETWERNQISQGANLIIVRASGTNLTDARNVEIDRYSSVSSKDGIQVDLSGAISLYDWWSLDVTVNGTSSEISNHQVTAGNTTLSDVTSAISTSIDSNNNYHSLAAPNDGTIWFTREGQEDITNAITAVTEFVPTIPAPSIKHLTLTENSNNGDIWSIALPNTVASPITYTSTGTSIETIADELASSITNDGNNQYDAITVTKSSEEVDLYILRTDGNNFGVNSSVSLPAGHLSSAVVLSGEVQRYWKQELSIESSSPADLAGSRETWKITLDGEVVSAVPTQGDTEADILAEIKTSIDNNLNLDSTTVAGNPITIIHNDGSRVGAEVMSISDIVQERNQAYVLDNNSSTSITEEHYTAYEIPIAGNIIAGQIWTIEVDGTQYSATAGKNKQWFSASYRIGLDLQSEINNDPLSVVSATIDLTQDNTSGNYYTILTLAPRDDGGLPNPFSVGVSTAPAIDQLATVLLDIDDTQLITGIIPYGFRTIDIGLTTLTLPDYLGYTIYPTLELELVENDGTTTPEVPLYTNEAAGCDEVVETCLTATDDGSNHAYDPIMQYALEANESNEYYRVKVGSRFEFNDTTLFGNTHGLVNWDFGVANGASYQLNTSIENHDYNEEAIELVDKKLHGISDSWLGIEATITDYLPEYHQYVVNIDGDSPSRFDNLVEELINEPAAFEVVETYSTYADCGVDPSNLPCDPTSHPIVDSYTVKLSDKPDDTVIFDAESIATRTYDSDEAFNPDAGFGENNDLQTRTATQRVMVHLGGTPSVGETLQLKLLSIDNPTDLTPFTETVFTHVVSPGLDFQTWQTDAVGHGFVDPVVYESQTIAIEIDDSDPNQPISGDIILTLTGGDVVTHAIADGETNAQIANALVTLIDQLAGYTASIETSNDNHIVITHVGTFDLESTEPDNVEINQLSTDYSLLIEHPSKAFFTEFVVETLSDRNDPNSESVLASSSHAIKSQSMAIELAGGTNNQVNVVLTDSSTNHVTTLQYPVTSEQDDAAIANGLVELIDALPSYTAELDSTIENKIIVSHLGSFSIDLEVDEVLTRHPATEINFEFSGTPGIAERWVATFEWVANDSSINTYAAEYTVQYRDTLADILNGIYSSILAEAESSQEFATIFENIDISAVGRTLSITNKDEYHFDVTIEADNSSDSAARIVPQLVFDSNNDDWKSGQQVYVIAIDDDVIDGGYTLAFPAMEARANAIRGPLSLEGGLRVGEERFLTNPVTLPTEYNYPLADGSFSSLVEESPYDWIVDEDARVEFGLEATPTQEQTDATKWLVLTDDAANHRNADYGERDGFDPRFNDYPYFFTLLNTVDPALDIDVAKISSNILSWDDATGYKIHYPHTEVDVRGTPDPTQTTNIGELSWEEATIQIGGTPHEREVWHINLAREDGNYLTTADLVADCNSNMVDCFSYTVSENDSTIGQVAIGLTNLINANEHYDAEYRISLTGDSRILIRNTNNTSFNIDYFGVTQSPDSAVNATSSVRGIGDFTDTSVQDAIWTDTSIIWDWDVANGPDSEWELVFNANDNIWALSATQNAASNSLAVLEQLKDDLTSEEPEYQPVISGTSVLFKGEIPEPLVEPFNTNANLADRDPVDLPGTASVTHHFYYYAPLNLNLRVVEEDQVDRFNFYHNDSPSDDIGVLTENHLTGLGMGSDVSIGDRIVAGGIQYTNMEVIDLNLGTGDDDLTVETTHSGLTLIDSNDGNANLTIKSILGHTEVDASTGTDVITITHDDTVDLIASLLTIDDSDGDLTINIDDSESQAQTTDELLNLSGDSISGLQMSTVAEVQEISVQAIGGTYTLTLPAFGNYTGGTSATINVEDMREPDAASTILAALIPQIGISNHEIHVGNPVIKGNTYTYRVTFLGDLAGLKIPQIIGTPTVEEFEAQTQNGPTSTLDADLNSSAGVTVSTVRHGHISTKQNEIQEFTVPSESIDYSIIMSPTHGLDGGTSHQLNFTSTASDLANAISEGIGLEASTISVVETDTSINSKTFRITFTGDLGGIDLPLLSASVSMPENVSDENPLTLIQNGSIARTNNIVNAITVSDATAGSFTIRLANQTSAALDYDASSEDVHNALDFILNPNNRDGSKPHTSNFLVTKHIDTFLIHMLGEYKDLVIRPDNVITSEDFNGSISVTRKDP